MVCSGKSSILMGAHLVHYIEAVLYSEAPMRVDIEACLLFGGDWYRVINTTYEGAGSVVL